MNIIEAFEAVKQGKKVSHRRYIAAGLKLYYDHIDEDGFLCTPDQVRCEINNGFLNNWSVINNEFVYKQILSDLEENLKESNKIMFSLEDIRVELKTLLESKKYGLKAIDLLWCYNNRMEFNFLDKILPWSLSSDDNRTLKEWLVDNHLDKMIENFLMNYN